jgi:hypothetical protein
MNSHPLSVVLRELVPLPDSVISQIVLFNSHPLADIVRELENTDYGRLQSYMIDCLNLPKNILVYNRVVFKRITQEKSASIMTNSRLIGIIMASEQISRIQCLTMFHNTLYCSRHPPAIPVMVHNNPIVIHRTEPRTRGKRALASQLSSSQLLLCCEAIKNNNDRCSNLKKDGTNYCRIHKNRI